MADPIAQDLLTDLETRREAVQIKAALDDILFHNERDEHAVLIATALAFQNACEMAELDEFDVLAQVLDTFPEGEVEMADDPAQGRFVHQPAYA